MSEECCGPTNAPAAEEPRTPWWQDRALWPPLIAGALLLIGYALEWAGAPTPAVVFQAGALAAGAATFVPGTIRRLARGKLGVGLLMTIAAAGAVALGHVGEAATLAFLFSLAEALEDRAMDRAKDGLRALLALIPDRVRIARGHGTATVTAAEVRVGDELIVAAGERIPTDGIVIAGASSLDTSAITGESIPVDVTVGADVSAGSVNGAGTLRIQATADGRDNSLTHIVALVEQAHAKKGARARLADRIAKPLVPAVLIVSAVVALYGVLIGEPAIWIERALVVLVAASPCALAIAVPVTVISAIGAASKFGVVIKSGQAFEQLGTVTTVALDKTGTLTENRPRVVTVRPNLGFTADDVLELASALEATSTHPLAAAIRAAAPEVPPAHDVHEEAGHGVSGTIDGRRVQAGNARWLDADTTALASAGMTVVVVAVDGAVAGLIGVRDELRAEAAEAVTMLRADGITPIMLTGDNRATAHALAAAADISTVYVEQTPADKAAVVASLGPGAAMVGDGINDAPALATASVGIAMGLTGSAAAIESADVAFTGRDLRLLPAGLAHARRGRRIMTTNIVLALAIIVGLFPLALFGVLGLAGVVLVHEIAEVFVILNGVRAARRPRDPAVGWTRAEHPELAQTSRP